MQVGDLCKVIEMGTHNPTQYGDHVILLQYSRELSSIDGEQKFKMWLVHNCTTGELHHHWEIDLELVLCK